MADKKIEICLVGGMKVYITGKVKRNRCQCGVMLYHTKTADGQDVVIHETANSGAVHKCKYYN